MLFVFPFAFGRLIFTFRRKCLNHYFSVGWTTRQVDLLLKQLGVLLLEINEDL